MTIAVREMVESSGWRSMFVPLSPRGERSSSRDVVGKKSVEGGGGTCGGGAGRNDDCRGGGGGGCVADARKPACLTKKSSSSLWTSCGGTRAAIAAVWLMMFVFGRGGVEAGWIDSDTKEEFKTLRSLHDGTEYELVSVVVVVVGGGRSVGLLVTAGCVC